MQKNYDQEGKAFMKDMGAPAEVEVESPVERMGEAEVEKIGADADAE